MLNDHQNQPRRPRTWGCLLGHSLAHDRAEAGCQWPRHRSSSPTRGAPEQEDSCRLTSANAAPVDGSNHGLGALRGNRKSGVRAGPGEAGMDRDALQPPTVTFSMTLKVSWHRVMMSRRYQLIRATSSPLGCRMSEAMSIRSTPGEKA